MALDLLAHQAVVALQQGPPSAIAQLCGTLGRADDVGEQHRREHAVADDRPPHTGQEVLDLVGDGVLLAEPERPLPGKLRIAGVRDVLGDIARVALVEVRLVLRAQHQRRALHAGKHVTHIRLADHRQRRGSGSRTHRQTLYARHQTSQPVVLDRQQGQPTGLRASRCPRTRRWLERLRRAARRSAPTRIPVLPPGGAAATPGRVPAPGPDGRPRTAPSSRSPRDTRSAPAARSRPRRSLPGRHRSAPPAASPRRSHRTSRSRAGRTGSAEKTTRAARRSARRTAAPRTARCSTGTTESARRRAGPRPPPGRRSADHRCVRNESPERPRATLSTSYLWPL